MATERTYHFNYQVVWLRLLRPGSSTEEAYECLRELWRRVTEWDPDGDGRARIRTRYFCPACDFHAPQDDHPEECPRCGMLLNFLWIDPSANEEAEIAEWVAQWRLEPDHGAFRSSSGLLWFVLCRLREGYDAETVGKIIIGEFPWPEE